MKLKSFNVAGALCFGLIFPFTSLSNFELLFQEPKIQSEEPVKLENPITVKYLQQHLRKSTPRLILNAQIENNLRAKLKSDPLVRSFFQNLKLEASKILQYPILITRDMEGPNGNWPPGEMLQRIGNLSVVYLIEKDPVILKRIDDEVRAVCDYPTWGGGLGASELSFAVAIAVDWVGTALPKETLRLAKTALIEKGILPSYSPSENHWIKVNSNWNQVCHGGMVAASIAIAEENPELAVKTISRALDNLPNSLKEYGPDGIYPEGPGYWGYGTIYSAITSSILTSAFGTDFGITDYPGFLKSADYRLLVTSPTGLLFNYSDCDEKEEPQGSILLAWFAAKTGNSIYLDKPFFSKPSTEHQKNVSLKNLSFDDKKGQVVRLAGGTYIDLLPLQPFGRFASLGLIWLSQFKKKIHTELPLEWHGGGSNPLVIFRSEEGSSEEYYLGGKGGRASNHHGNMDVGSFVFELNGVRWIIDPGNQWYSITDFDPSLKNFNLWNNCQDCQRYTLLTKSNFGHSTLTVDDSRHNVNGFAPITEFKAGPVPEAILDMTDIFIGHLKSAQRKFTKDTNHSIVIEDQFVLGDSTRLFSWAIMTTADVNPLKGGALLELEGKRLNLQILAPDNVNVSIISLDPPPLKYDRRIENLKRVEIRVPAYLYSEGKGSIKVRLFSQE